MKRKLFWVLAAILAAALLLTGCPADDGDGKKPETFEPPADWIGFSEAEMLAAKFYFDDGENAGNIVKNANGTYEVTIKTRDSGERHSVVYFTFTDKLDTLFRHGYYVNLTLPKDAAQKPVQVHILPSETDDGTNGTWPASNNSDVTGDLPATIVDGYVVGDLSIHWGTETSVAYKFKTLAIWFTWAPFVVAGNDYTFTINEIKVKPLAGSGDPDPEAWTPPAVAEPNGWKNFSVDTGAVTFFPEGGSIVKAAGDTYTVTAKTRSDGHTEIVFKGSDFSFMGGYYLSFTLPNQTASSTMKPSRIYTYAINGTAPNWNSAVDLQQAFKWIQGKVDCKYEHSAFNVHDTIVLQIYWHSDVAADQDYVFTINKFLVKE